MEVEKLNEHYPVGPNTTIAWIDQLVRRYGIGHMNDITRAVDLLAPTVWRRRHQLIVQTLDALNSEQLRAILATHSFAAYFGKELTSKEKYEALQWTEWKLSMLPKKQNQFINGLAAELFQHTKVLQDAPDSV